MDFWKISKLGLVQKCKIKMQELFCTQYLNHAYFFLFLSQMFLCPDQ